MKNFKPIVIGMIALLLLVSSGCYTLLSTNTSIHQVSKVPTLSTEGYEYALSGCRSSNYPSNIQTSPQTPQAYIRQGLIQMQQKGAFEAPYLSINQINKYYFILFVMVPQVRFVNHCSVGAFLKKTYEKIISA